MSLLLKLVRINSGVEDNAFGTRIQIFNAQKHYLESPDTK